MQIHFRCSGQSVFREPGATSNSGTRKAQITGTAASYAQPASVSSQHWHRWHRPQMYQYKHQQLLARFIKISLKYHNISRFWEGGGGSSWKKYFLPSKCCKECLSHEHISIRSIQLRGGGECATKYRSENWKGRTTFGRPSSRWNIKTDLTEAHVRCELNSADFTDNNWRVYWCWHLATCVGKWLLGPNNWSPTSMQYRH